MTAEKFANLKIGDVVDARSMFPKISAAPTELKVTTVASVSVRFVATWMGVTLGVFIATLVKGEVKGVLDCKIDLIELIAPLKMEIKPSMSNDKATFVLVHAKGNLCLMVAAGANGKPLYLFVLNLAKMDGMSGWFQTHNPASSGEAARILGDAVVARYEERNGRWHPMQG